MSKVFCAMLARLLKSETKAFRTFARKCAALVAKYHLFASRVKFELRSRNDFYFDLEKQFA